MRLCFMAGGILLCVGLAPLGNRLRSDLALGVAITAVVLLAEAGLERSGVRARISTFAGALGGLLAALLFALIVTRAGGSEPLKSFLSYMGLYVFGYLGVAMGLRVGQQFKGGAFENERRAEAAGGDGAAQGKLLDTSVLIDGRIAEICEAQFLEGVLIVPQFVLRELQMVADSSDALKRQRGRRGLEVLQRMQKMAGVEVRVVEEDAPGARDVDQKLLEVASRLKAKLVTNDFNLNKVAAVRGIAVLNVNHLASALKPVVLPGEPMHVFILREGKEQNQGVAYLDDGTMVVVDGARRFINKAVDINVTSVHQTPVGKMIFGRLDERGEAALPLSRGAAAATGPGVLPSPSPNAGGGTSHFPDGPTGGPAAKRPTFSDPDSETR
ncbi:MAG: TRAM domain-containing protein [Acidobacteriia bacterium]|nr:TRAM domain-containing protein [Terriglobia bacterium]